MTLTPALLARAQQLAADAPELTTEQQERLRRILSLSLTDGAGAGVDKPGARSSKAA